MFQSCFKKTRDDWKKNGRAAHARDFSLRRGRIAEGPTLDSICNCLRWCLQPLGRTQRTHRVKMARFSASPSVDQQCGLGNKAIYYRVLQTTRLLG